MGTRKGNIPGGLLIPERCRFSTLAANTGTSTTSSYTEAGPRPGLPVVSDANSQLRLELSGEQGVDMDVRVVKSGQPAREGLQVAIREDGDATWLTHESHTAVMGSFALDWGNAATQVADIATIPSTQTVIVARVDTNASNAVKLTTFDKDHTQTNQTATIATGTDWNYPALVVLPGSERVLCFYGGSAYYTDDLGATWTTLANNITSETTTNYGPTCAVVYRGDIVLFVEDIATAETIHHLVSTDGGATFNLVQSTASLGARVDAVANEDGIHVVWVDQGTAVEYRRLGTAFEPLDAVTQTAIDSGVFDESTIWADGLGTLYALYSGSAISNASTIKASYDSGVTWSTYRTRTWSPGDSTDKLGSYRATYALGQAWVVAGHHNGTTWATTSPVVVVLGGWSDVQFSAQPGAIVSQRPEERWGYGGHDLCANEQGATYFGVYTPANEGWTLASSGTGSDSASSNGGREVTTSTGTRSWSKDLSTTVDSIVARARLKVSSGGSASTQDVAITLRIADASSYEFEAEILFALSGSDLSITVNDINSAATASATISGVSGFTDVYAWMESDQNSGAQAIQVYYRSPGALNWTSLSSVALTDAGATANNSRMVWGHIASATATSVWAEVHYATANGTTRPQLIAAIGSRWSRAFNARPEAIPGIGTTTGAAWLAAVGGPARRGETVNINAHHDYPVEHLHCELFPGLDAKWRSTDTSEQIFCYDLTANAWLGHSVALFVAGANFRTAYLESYNGATWDTEATLDLSEGFASLEYTLTGETVYPDTATTSDAGRWMWEQELRNGVAIFNGSTGPAQAATRILSQSSGGWTQTATVIPMLRLEDVSVISTLAGTKTVRLCAPSGLVLAHQTAVKARRYWRVRIPAGTAGDDTPEGESYYEASIIAICRVQAFGAETHWGNTDESSMNLRTRRDERGTDYVRALGRPARAWTLGGWAEAPTNHGQNVRLTIGADYVGSSESNALALTGFEDVFHHLRGTLRVLDDGALPCIAVEPLPNASDTTLTDPSRVLYGRLTSTIRARRLVGDYDDTGGQGEVVRPDDITIVELV